MAIESPNTVNAGVGFIDPQFLGRDSTYISSVGTDSGPRPTRKVLILHSNAVLVDPKKYDAIVKLGGSDVDNEA